MRNGIWVGDLQNEWCFLSLVGWGLNFSDLVLQLGLVQRDRGHSKLNTKSFLKLLSDQRFVLQSPKSP